MKKPSHRPKAHPQLKRERADIRLPAWLIEWLDNQDQPKSKTIEEALLKHYDLVAPVVNKES